ncbi:hypothetical protein F5888DRAFT_1909218 [Russula emetica]|nr:hypothetical protein F5888DRAFT_1909218 [Russula emetica]
MSTSPSTSTLHSNFASIFDAALENYKRKTKKDLASHPLLPTIQSCNSAEAIITVLREQVPVSSQSRNSDDGLTKWVAPTVNAMYAFSATIGQGVGLALPPANAIFAGIGVLLLAAKDASTSQERIIDIFNRIEYFFRRLEIYTVLTPTAAMTDMIVEIMVEVLTILTIVTKEVESGQLKKYLKKLTGNRDIEDSLERLDKLTQEEARMASAELLKMTQSVDGKVMGVDDRVKGVEGKMQDVRDDVQDVSDDVQGVGNKVQDVDDRVQDIGKDISIRVQGVNDKLDQANRNQLRDSLLRWLSPPDPSANHNIACKAHHSGTAEWFFRGSIFSRWKSTGSSLWIHGKPGSGKSVLCSSIIQDILALCDAERASMAYFYFDFRDVDKQKLHDLLPSLLIQLSARSDPCCDILSQLHSTHNRGVWKPSDRAMVECLKEMLSLEAQPPIYIILDALDECPVTSTVPPSPREEVLEFVDELVGLHLPNVHICVTSRPEHDIQVLLEGLTEHSVSLHDESGQQEDITNYVTSYVRSNQRMRRWRDEDKNLVIKTLSEKADGMFRWAYCQLEVLRHCFPSNVRCILEELPDSLDATYERILREIRKPNQGHAHRLLQCLVAATRPLQVEELAEVLAFDFSTEGIPKFNLGWRWEDQEEAVMSACSSLVMIVKDEAIDEADEDSRVVQFSHFSVKEFLMANRLAEPIRDVSRYHIQLEAAHTILVRACLGVLLGLDDGVDRDNIEGFPLARYAARYWPTHAKVGNVSSRIKDGMECLFDADKPHFATWVWIYDEDQWGDIMPTMHPEKPNAVPLYYAVMLGFRNLAEHLIAEHPEQVNTRGGLQVTPLHVAASGGHSDILSLLIEHGADINALGALNDTPLAIAMCYGTFDLEFIRMLLERGAVVNSTGYIGRTGLLKAAATGQTEVMRLFLEDGADVNVHDEPPSPMWSIWEPQEQEIVKWANFYRTLDAPLHPGAPSGNGPIPNF